MEINDTTKQAARQHRDNLFALPNVNGVGYGKKITGGVVTDIDAIIVLVRKKKPIERNFLKWLFLGRLHPANAVPAVLDGVDTDVVHAGELVAQQDPTKRWRPCPGGVSIGHYKVTAGTLAYWFRHKVSGRIVGLTNNHVGANSNDAELGDPWRQPAPYDKGTEADEGCELADFVPIVFSPVTCPIGQAVCDALNALAALFGRKTRFTIQQDEPTGTNTVDCAIGFPINDLDPKMEILGVGEIVPEPIEATIGIELQKFGRTTSHTFGSVISLDTTVSVNYGGPIAIFEHQITAGPMSAGGDSGSLVLDMDNRPVGLLFAGSDEVTICNRIQDVVDALEIEFV